MRAVVVEHGSRPRLVLAERPEPSAEAGELLIAVRAISLNRGEVRHALSGEQEGHNPGWDYAGVVERSDGRSGFQPGDRVFGLLPYGSWAERVATTPSRISAIPDGVSFGQAAALPVAGLTAALALAKGGDLSGRSVLVTGSTGGVGLIAIQLAAKAGAIVAALVRGPDQGEMVRRLGAAAVAADLEDVTRLGPYDLAVEAVGGAVLGAVLGALRGLGQCILVGDAGGSVTTFDAADFRRFGATTLYGFFLGDELTRSRPSDHLAKLAEMVAAGALDPVVTVERSWTEIDGMARDLLDRRFSGKAVLTIP